LRTRLREQEQGEGKGFLHRWLVRVDPQTANRVHPNDLVRLIRALEVFLLTGTPLSQWQMNHGFRDQPFNTLTVGLVMQRETLAYRIEQRCREMVRDGLVEEVQRLWEMGYSPELAPLQTIGYTQIGEMLRGQYGLEDAITRMAQETRRLAKRQLTWLRAEPDVRWFAPTQRREITEAIEMFFERLAAES